MKSAKQAFENRQAVIARQIAKLTELVEETAATTDDPNWGHVGSAGHVVDQLAEVIAFLSNREVGELPAELRDAETGWFPEAGQFIETAQGFGMVHLSEPYGEGCKVLVQVDPEDENRTERWDLASAGDLVAA